MMRLIFFMPKRPLWLGRHIMVKAVFYCGSTPQFMGEYDGP